MVEVPSQINELVPSFKYLHLIFVPAHITSTLNLINTTALSPWQQHDPLPWEDDYDLTNHATAATKRSAGSLFNIPSTCKLVACLVLSDTVLWIRALKGN